ncbi:MAG: hypothetical protein EBY16_05795 [Gammaproteobacteria bacterium]|nr:hypothetical protein [Gammaproteobacteria bacterium]
MFQQARRVSTKMMPRHQLKASLQAAVLLAEPRREECVKLIEQHLGFSALRYQQMVKPLIDEVAVACQLLPSTQHRFYALEGGLLDYALYRAQAACMLFRQTALPPDTKELSDEQSLWAYVVFSAALLRGLGVVSTDYHVICYDAAGYSIGNWRPLWERFIDRTEFYQYELNSNLVDGLKQHITPFLARVWMPSVGLSWIAEHPEAFLAWLILLQEEHEELGVLEAIFERAEALAWQELAKQALHHEPSELPLDVSHYSSFVDKPTEQRMRDDLLGLQFLLWLKENLARGQIVLQQDHLKLTENGLIIGEETYKWFLQHHKDVKNWRLVQKGLMSLGLHHQDFVDGKLILNTKVFFPKEMIVRMHAEQQHHQKIQSIQLVAENLKRIVQGKNLNLSLINKVINAKGQWEVLNQEQYLGPGMKNV